MTASSGLTETKIHYPELLNCIENGTLGIPKTCEDILEKYELLLRIMRNINKYYLKKGYMTTIIKQRVKQKGGQYR